jgi:predicted MFS family arabinose efflux permease
MSTRPDQRARTPQQVPAHPAPSAARSAAGLIALASAGLTMMLVETIPGGLLRRIAEELHAPPALIGQFVTVYALVAGVGALLLGPVVAARLPDRLALPAALLLSALSSLVVAAAPDAWVALAARLVGGLASAVVWARQAPAALSLVPPERHGRALATVTIGVPVALTVGLPLGTALGQALGWRATFLVLAALAVVTAVAVAVLLPVAPHRPPERSRRLAGPVRVVLAAVALFAIGHNAAFTYITLLAPSTPPEQLLLAFGIGACAAIVVVRFVVDARMRVALPAAFLLMAGGVTAVSLASGAVSLPSAFVWGLGMGGMPALLQAWIARVSPTAQLDWAIACLVAILNVGVAAGALVGGGIETVAQRGPAVFGVLVLVAGGVIAAVAVPRGPGRTGLDEGPPRMGRGGPSTPR